MRWKEYDDVTYSTVGSPTVGVGEILSELIVSAVQELDVYNVENKADNANVEIRLAGHSLGNQVVISAASNLLQRFFSPFSKQQRGIFSLISYPLDTRRKT